MSPLHAYHHRHAEHFIDHFGYSHPVHYTAPQQEYRAAQSAAMMDAGFFGKLRVTGKDREPLLHRLTANEMRRLQPGESRVNLFTTARGRVVDRVEMLAEETGYLLLTSPGRAAALQQWIEKYTFIEEVKIADLTAEFGMISLFGAESAERLQKAAGFSAADLRAGQFAKFFWQNAEIIVLRPQAASPARLQLILPMPAVAGVWEALLPQFVAMGFSAHEMMRIMQGIPAADHEIVEEYNPHEIGLYPFINFDKGCYIGQEVIARLDSYQKVQRQLVGVKCAAEADSLPGATVWRQEQEAGKLTSVAPAPQGGGAIGLAVVRKTLAQAGSAVVLRCAQQTFAAELVNVPFGD